jgi:hypothetical protein
VIVEEARRIANDKFLRLLQPLIDDSPLEPDPSTTQAEVTALIAEIRQETGFEVERFYVNPLGFGMYEVTTVFKTGETRRRSEGDLLYS